MKKYAKFVVAAMSAAAVIASSGLLSGEAAMWVNTIVAAVGAALVYLVPNVQLPESNRPE